MGHEDPKSLAELSVHFEYMRNSIKAVHDRMDEMPTNEQLRALENKVDRLQSEVEDITKLANTLVTLERISKWFAAIAAGVAVIIVIFKAFKA